MLIQREAKVSHEIGPVHTILSDPAFVIPRVLPPVKVIEVTGNSFKGSGQHFVYLFGISGTVYRGVDITYVFSIKGNGTGNGRIVISPGSLLKFTLEYEGYMERNLRLFSASKWVDNFLKNLDEDIRIERIRRKI
ncbi:DUF3211 domain-containing protein [Metallosphaera tengchongensis]|uniref:DUF3211 domain-containing protein n=1 Tax=Metallosphaera tengchongensis TaxID=1532350 RepID=A0A6N0NT27_9CREN|nr:STK_08120 family protein [Metallosphaera tengchongensis]QKQ99008.1 DUF3211 domain-containing protein [Metallosphaera tengchongensis]